MAPSLFRSPLVVGVTALAASAVIGAPVALVALPSDLRTPLLSDEAIAELHDIVDTAQEDIAFDRADIRDGGEAIRATRQQAATEVGELLDGPDTDREAVQAVVATAHDDVTAQRAIITAEVTDIHATRRDAAGDIVEVVRADMGDTVDEIVAIVEPARAEIDDQQEIITSELAANREVRQGARTEVAEIVDSVKDDEIDKEAAAEEIANVIEAAHEEAEENKETAREARSSIKTTRKDTGSQVRDAVRDRKDSGDSDSGGDSDGGSGD